MNDQQLSLYQLQQQVKGSLDDTFSMPVWVKAEISEMTVNRSGHCYLDLIETESGTDTVIARCRATIWSYTFRMLKPYFETTSGQTFTEGLKVLLQAKVEYHEVFGFSLNIRDIDPVYTLGDLARQRREIIRKLQEDGVFEMNKELELPLVTQRIAIISSPTAAGLQDFLDQLHNNPHQFVFYTKLFPAVMQGTEAPRSIMNALDLIFEYEDMFDAVVIIRGGGAQIDLACFDQYELAFNVAQFPLPVITGIGHDKDDTVIDMVAHTRMKTPTAVAEFLISGALQFSQQLNELESHFIELVNEQLEENKNRLNDAADLLSHLVNEMIVAQQNRLKIAQIQLANRTEAFLKRQQSELKQLTMGAKNKTNRFVTRQNHLLDQSGNKLNFVFREQMLKSKNQLSQFQYLIKIRSTETIRAEKKNLSSIQEKLRLVDPQNILKRGYSLTMLNGKIVKSVRQIKEGDLLETRLGDGTAESTVDKIKH
ncbi:exodeoxyribonuclease VII large subunit [Aquipluma nitroreducens]|uniref:Exodeoxyribonuclease 7 large subunit n=1 Tax=Aquipluma nitroreducens TaxID=2010828 RepID=A0A5K7SC30_9BACT|nr:exodeoxyribonuclease VII large subunit [Aquipluma nitroreducens]BBE19133.1 exodeoxyribonuclease VII large subunit [Aquipluma nitroreducens]